MLSMVEEKLLTAEVMQKEAEELLSTVKAMLSTTEEIRSAAEVTLSAAEVTLLTTQEKADPIADEAASDGRVDELGGEEAAS